MSGTNKHVVLLTLTCVMLTASTMPAEFPMPYTLDNGLTVILRPVSTSNQVAVVVLFNLGGDHDPIGKSGRAHLLEHLYCTAAAGDTPARDVMQFQKHYVAGWNAQTGSDYTVFAGVVEAKQFAAELEDAADRMNSLHITESNLNRELPRVLLELRNMYGGMPSLAGLNYMRSQLHPIPQGGQHGGAPEHIKAITLDELQQYWKDYYKPNNAILSLAGRFDVAEAQKLIHQEFSQIPSGKSPPAKLPKSETNVGTPLHLRVEPVMPNAAGVAAIGYVAPLPGNNNYAPFLIVVSRLWANSQHIFQPGKTMPVYYPPLDDTTMIVLQTDLPTDKDDESVLNQLDQRLQAALTPELTPQDKQRAINSMAMLGTVDVPDTWWTQNLYGLAFSVGRLHQLKIDGRALRAAIQSVTDTDVENLASILFASEKRGSVIVRLKK